MTRPQSQGSVAFPPTAALPPNRTRTLKTSIEQAKSRCAQRTIEVRKLRPIWPAEYAQDTFECAWAFVRICWTWDNQRKETRQMPNRRYLRQFVWHWHHCKTNKKVLVVHKCRRMIISWCCRCLELWSMGLQKQDLMLGGEDYMAAAKHCQRLKFLWDDLRARYEDWGLGEARFLAHEGDTLKLFALPNGSVTSIINSQAGQIQGEGAAIVTLEEFGLYANPQSMLAQANIVTMGDVDGEGKAGRGFVCCITNNVDNPKYKDFKKVGADEVQLRELFPGYSVRVMKSGAVFLKIEWNADETRGSQWLEDTRLAMAETAYEFNLEILMNESEVGGALWKWDDISQFRLHAIPEGVNIVKTVVALDPSVSDPERVTNRNKEPDACGIIVASLDDRGHVYVRFDGSGVLSPENWVQKAVNAAQNVPCDEIVYEQNQGGKLVELSLKTFGARVKITPVVATKGKRVRAEPVAVLYSLGKVHHVGHLSELEVELTSWDSTNPSAKSPNRLDALVWAVHGLGLCKYRPAYVIDNMIDSVPRNY